MRKYSFLVFHEDYESFLIDLRQMGLLHIATAEKELSDEVVAKLTKLKRVKNVMREVEDNRSEETTALNLIDGEAVLAFVERKTEEINALSQNISNLQKERDSMVPWGDYKETSLKGIADAGYKVQFFTCEEKNWNEAWRETADFELVNQIQSELFLMAISKLDSHIDFPNLDEAKLVKPLSEYDKELEVLQQQFSNHVNELKASSAYCAKQLQIYVNELEAQLDFSLAIESGKKTLDDKVMVLTGWVPQEANVQFAKVLDEKHIVYLSEKPGVNDVMPVKLKNNYFSKLFESIGELYTLPNHKELDLTPFFAPFYMLFFGFCLGDAGYGLLIVIGTLLGLRKVKPEFKPILKLGFFLGLATTIMGIVGGTFFGVMFGLGPDGEVMQQVSWLKTYQAYVLNTDNLMVLSLVLGYIQVIFGMVLKAVNLARVYGFRFAISQIGWIVIVGVTIPFYALGMFEMMDVDQANLISLVSGVIGAIPALLYNTPDKGVLLNFGAGLWNTYGMASGLLGDVLSYIRLFALGLSSAILGSVFNSLAMDLSPETIVLRQLVIVLILAFGHSLNLFMALLGSFVHPLRLTFVEFYKNAGFEGGGHKYKPFALK